MELRQWRAKKSIQAGLNELLPKAMQPILFQTPAFSFGERRLSLSFYSCAYPTNHLFCIVRLSEDDEVDIRIDFGIYAYDLDRFLSQVEALHQTLQGNASLQALGP